MELGRGWATDYGKNRFDVRADESDLLRMLAEAGFDDPVKTAAAMKSSDVMRVLDAELMTYVHFTLSNHEPPKRDQHLAKMAEYRAERDRILVPYRPQPEPGTDGEPVAG